MAAFRIAAALVGAWIAALLPAMAETSNAATVQPEIPIVTTARAEIGAIQARVPVTGSLVAREPVQVHANVSGQEIREIRAEVGDRVKAGDVLAVLNDDTLAAQLAQADAEYQRAVAGVRQAESQIASADASATQAATALTRTQALRESGNTSQAVLDQAIATEASARADAASAADGLGVAQAVQALADAQRKIALLNLGYATISAPVDGLIVGRSAEVGAISGTGGEPLFTLITRGEIELAADIIETALAEVEPGDRAEVQVSGLGTVGGKVRLVPAAVDPVTRLGPARISLDAGPGLRMGLFANGWVITDTRDALTVPASAVLSDGEGQRVQLVRDGKVETRPVRAGILWQGRREIVEGVAEGDEVIARAGAFFRNGDQVRAAP